MCLCVQKALELMSLVPKRCNDMMNLGRLQGYEVHLSVYLVEIRVGICDAWPEINDMLQDNQIIQIHHIYVLTDIQKKEKCRIYDLSHITFITQLSAISCCPRLLRLVNLTPGQVPLM